MPPLRMIFPSVSSTAVYLYDSETILCIPGTVCIFHVMYFNCTLYCQILELFMQILSFAMDHFVCILHMYYVTYIIHL